MAQAIAPKAPPAVAKGKITGYLPMDVPPLGAIALVDLFFYLL